MGYTVFILSGVLITLLSSIYFELKYGQSSKIHFLSYLFTPYFYCSTFALNGWSIFIYSESLIADVWSSTLAMLTGGLISYMVLDSFGVIYGIESWYRENQRAKNRSP